LLTRSLGDESKCLGRAARLQRTKKLPSDRAKIGLWARIGTDGTKIMCARRLGDMNLVIFPAPR